MAIDFAFLYVNEVGGAKRSSRMNAIESRAGGMRKSDPGPARSIAWMALAGAMLMGCVVAPVAPPPSPRPAPPPPVHTPQGRSPAATPASSPMYFYPERGQGEAQQDRDRGLDVPDEQQLVQADPITRQLLGGYRDVDTPPWALERWARQHGLVPEPVPWAVED